MTDNINNAALDTLARVLRTVADTADGGREVAISRALPDGMGFADAMHLVGAAFDGADKQPTDKAKQKLAVALAQGAAYKRLHDVTGNLAKHKGVSPLGVRAEVIDMVARGESLENAIQAVSTAREGRTDAVRARDAIVSSGRGLRAAIAGLYDTARDEMTDDQRESISMLEEALAGFKDAFGFKDPTPKRLASFEGDIWGGEEGTSDQPAPGQGDEPKA